eukprot:1188698-Prorocentrum_minimum.AAC.5
MWRKTLTHALGRAIFPRRRFVGFPVDPSVIHTRTLLSIVHKTCRPGLSSPSGSLLPQAASHAFVQAPPVHRSGFDSVVDHPGKWRSFSDRSLRKTASSQGEPRTAASEGTKEDNGVHAHASSTTTISPNRDQKEGEEGGQVIQIDTSGLLRHKSAFQILDYHRATTTIRPLFESLPY